jgi:uncharacterized iron-regulated membrane protein
MRKLLFNLHLYGALVAGIFITLFGITGSIMAFEPELDHVLHRHRSYVAPQGQPKPLTELATAAAKYGLDQPAFLPSVSPSISYAIEFRDRIVYINQYTGEVLEVRHSTVDSLDVIHQLHLRLATPFLSNNRTVFRVGQRIMDVSGVVALFLVLSGVYLWWPTKRVRVEWRSGGRKLWFDLHNAVGIFSLVFLLILCVTGMMIGFKEMTVPLAYELTGSQEVEVPKQQIEVQPGKPLITPDQAVEIASTALPGATPILLTSPNPRQLVRVNLRYPEDRTPGGRSRVFIDPYSGKVMFSDSSRTTAAGTKVVTLIRAIHTGDVFGTPSKTVMSLASLAIAMQMVSGMVMWWKRVRANKRARAHR